MVYRNESGSLSFTVSPHTFLLHPPGTTETPAPQYGPMLSARYLQNTPPERSSSTCHTPSCLRTQSPSRSDPETKSSSIGSGPGLDFAGRISSSMEAWLQKIFERSVNSVVDSFRPTMNSAHLGLFPALPPPKEEQPKLSGDVDGGGELTPRQPRRLLQPSSGLKDGEPR